MTTPCDVVLEYLIACAQNHGEQSEPDHEVGDLQQLLRIVWPHLSPAQTHAVFNEYTSLDGWAPDCAYGGRLLLRAGNLMTLQCASCDKAFDLSAVLPKGG